MQKWTVTEIADRFEEAARTLRRLPPVKVRGYFNTWPPVIRTAQELLDAEPVPLQLGPPTAGAIARMEETLEWIFLLDDEDERRLVWLRAEGVRWRKICARIGCKRTKAWQLWSMALLKIATRLNH
ncbi:MAG: DUF6362 family protein [Alphaproteobacteria bacterium]|nr:DUF6362 family protein [Alphaproteobacteria bacterium]